MDRNRLTEKQRRDRQIGRRDTPKPDVVEHSVKWIKAISRTAEASTSGVNRAALCVYCKTTLSAAKWCKINQVCVFNRADLNPAMLSSSLNYVRWDLDMNIEWLLTECRNVKTECQTHTHPDRFTGIHSHAHTYTHTHTPADKNNRDFKSAFTLKISVS